MAQAIAGNGTQAINYFLGTKYVEALAKMGSSNNAKMFFLPVEAAGVMASIAGIGDSRIVRRGNFLGVVASKEYDAIQAATQLKVVYANPPTISGSGNLWREMRSLGAAGQAPARVQFQSGDVGGAPAAPGKVRCLVPIHCQRR